MSQETIDGERLEKLLASALPVADKIAKFIGPMAIPTLDVLVALRLLRNFTVGLGFNRADIDALEEILDMYCPPIHADEAQRPVSEMLSAAKNDAKA